LRRHHHFTDGGRFRGTVTSPAPFCPGDSFKLPRAWLAYLARPRCLGGQNLADLTMRFICAAIARIRSSAECRSASRGLLQGRGGRARPPFNAGQGYDKSPRVGGSHQPCRSRPNGTCLRSGRASRIAESGNLARPHPSNALNKGICPRLVLAHQSRRGNRTTRRRTLPAS